MQLEAIYQYDVYGNRTQKSVDDDGSGAHAAVLTRYALDGWNPAKPPPVGLENFDIWGVFSGAGSLTSRNFHGDHVDQPFARIDGSTPYWNLGDHLGSIRTVLDGSGVVKDSIIYDGYGNITSETDATKRGMYSWTGRELDAETNLQYNRARYYDATTARWISQDPMGFDAGDSNLYRYVNNAPTDATDPSGMQINPGVAIPPIPGSDERRDALYRKAPLGHPRGSVYITTKRSHWRGNGIKYPMNLPSDSGIEEGAIFATAMASITGMRGIKGNNNVYMAYSGPDATNVRWIQFVQMTVVKLVCQGNKLKINYDRVGSEFSVDAVYKISDPNEPVFNVDVLGAAATPYYHEPNTPDTDGTGRGGVEAQRSWIVDAPTSVPLLGKDSISYFSFTSYAVDITKNKVIGRVLWYSYQGEFTNPVKNAISSPDTEFIEPNWPGYGPGNFKAWLTNGKDVFDGKARRVIKSVQSGGTYAGADFQTQVKMIDREYGITLVGQ